MMRQVIPYRNNSEEMKILRHYNEHAGGSIQRDCRFYLEMWFIAGGKKPVGGK